MFYIDEKQELNIELLQKMLNKFQLNTLPKLQHWKNYYEGKHKILSKFYSDSSKPCNKIVTNFCRIISDTYNGYICGKPITYTSNDDITDIQEVINYNDSEAEDIAFLSNLLIYGVAYELHWLGKAAKHRYTQINPLNGFAIYDNTLDNELLYFVRWYKANNFNEDDLHYIEVYSKHDIKTYSATRLNGQLQFVEEKPHYFNDVPVSVACLNDEEKSIFEPIITLNDAYNELQSSEVDDFNAFCDAYLVLEGMDADTEDVAAMKENRVLLIPEGGKAYWLTKNANDTQIVNILDNIKKNIFKVSACPDMADETFLAQSGTALAYKLVGFENVASSIVTRLYKAIQRRIELICNVLNLKASEAVWRDIRINFTRNLPQNITEAVQLVNGLHGVVSDKTLLAQLPFIDDIDAELEAISEQRAANMELYSFDTSGFEEEEEEV